ncbi:hypothetical protein VX159_06935 [Dechloromonas sp. ZY10]|uniref:hypothetical protein n=1 Tax=Dechloromonas aquae TaxID=2664436 RepID=UPI003529B733
MQDLNPYQDWRIALIPHIPGFPLPVVGLAAPTPRWSGMVSLHLTRDVALHLPPSEVVVQETNFADFIQLAQQSAVGQAVAASLADSGNDNPFDLVAVTSYCLSKGISQAADVERATRLILEAYRELARQIDAQNRARLH